MVRCQGAASKRQLSTKSVPESDNQNAESLYKPMLQNKKCTAVPSEMLDDDYANDKFEVYDDDFETDGERSSSQVRSLLVTALIRAVENLQDLLYSLMGLTQRKQDTEDLRATHGTGSAGCLEPHSVVDENSVRKFQVLKECMGHFSFKVYSQLPIDLHELFGMGCGPAAHVSAASTQTNHDDCGNFAQTAKVVTYPEACCLLVYWVATLSHSTFKHYICDGSRWHGRMYMLKFQMMHVSH